MEIMDAIAAYAVLSLAFIVMGVWAFAPAIRAWGKSRVRSLGKGDTYVRVTPNFGIGIRFGKTRIRYARHHGLQLMQKRRGMWHVEKQLFGTSKVKAE